MPTTTAIYALVDPRDDEVRYVGKTCRKLQYRLKQHLCRTNLTPRRHSSRWLSGLVADGLAPTAIILESVEPGCDWQDAERRWINYYRSIGARLTNLTDGGEGLPGHKWTAERKEQQSDLMRGRTFDEEWRRKLSDARRGKSTGSPAPASEAKRLASHHRAMLEKAAKKTHCRKGHELSGENLISTSPTTKSCRICQQAASRLKYEKRRPIPKTAAEISLKQKEVGSRPQIKAVRSIGAKVRWKDPVYRDKHLARLKEAGKQGGAKTIFKGGEDHPGRKLTWPQVDCIRARVAAGESRRTVGAEYGIAITTVDQIVQERSWKLEDHPNYLKAERCDQSTLSTSGSTRARHAPSQ